MKREKNLEDKEQRITKKNSKNYDDNVSMHSKNSMVSTKSIKQKYLRGVSLNNREHLDGISKKEQDLKNHNLRLIENFINSLNKMGSDMRKVFPDKLQQKIDEIWN